MGVSRLQIIGFGINYSALRDKAYLTVMPENATNTTQSSGDALNGYKREANRMKNKAMMFVILASILLGFTARASAGVIELELVPTEILVGDSFDVTVRANGEGLGEELLAFGFNVLFESDLLALNGFTVAADFDDFSDPFSPINVAGDAFPGIATNSVLLATLSFSALAAGPTSFGIEGADGGFFLGLFYEFSTFDISSQREITIQESVAIPEPSTALLMTIALGLAGFARFRLQEHQG